MPSPSTEALEPRTPLQWARLVFTLALIPFTHSAFRDPYGAVPILNEIDLAVHEFGHMLFMPFGWQFLGETMVILGGSLVQVVFPLIFFVYFLRAREGRRDQHAAAFCLWWTAISLLGVAIYMGDARHGQLMLITGETGEEGGPHDWTELLARWGVLHRGDVYASRLRVLAGMLCAVSIIWGVLAAWWRKPLRPVAETPELSASLSAEVSA